MKLQTTLPNRAGLLYTAPLLDVVLLLIIFFLLGSNFVLRSGYSVNVPFSASSLPPMAKFHVVTLTEGQNPQIYFNEDRITLEELPVRLDEASEQARTVIIWADKLASYGSVVSVSNIVLQKGYELVYATSNDPTATP